MRRARVVWLGLLLVPLAGCLNDRPARSTSLIDRVRGIGGPSGPDAVFVEYAVIERPAGNAAMNREIWKNIDELIIPSETRALLAENGMRAGIVSGLLPSDLEGMIANPRSALGHRQRRLYLNNPGVITLSGPVALAEYQVRTAEDATPTTVKFEQAKFSMSFTPSPASDNRLTLKCVPEVEYHDKKHWTPTGATGPAWNGKPTERYLNLGWEVKLSPREFLVIGADYDRGAWLGNQIFTDTAGTEKVQRLLIVRTGRVSRQDLEPPAATPKDGVIPLASQATTSAIRGRGP